MSPDEARDVMTLAHALDRTCLADWEAREALRRLILATCGDPPAGIEPPPWERLARGSKP